MNFMDFESVNKTAERLGVTIRTVQKWCKEGKIEGAKKIGRDWMIPVDAIKSELSCGESTPVENHSEFSPLPLFNEPFPLGGCLEYIKSIQDSDKRNIALGEYHYYRGEFDKAAELLEPYIHNENLSYSFTAALICAYSNLAEKHIHIAEFSFAILKGLVERELKNSPFEEYKALAVWADITVATQFQYPLEKIAVIDDKIRYLSQGQKIFGCYLMAYRAYLEKDYSRALGIADTALVCFPEVYPIATAYLHIIATISLLNLMRTQEAKLRIKKAWDIVGKDGLIIPFIEHYSLLHGMIEIYFKKSNPEVFQKIMAAIRKFNTGWYKVHNERTGEYIADNLTTKEFTIAMLYNKGWRIKEIAAHIALSERTVKNYIQIIYEKLGISCKKELDKYMMK